MRNADCTADYVKKQKFVLSHHRSTSPPPHPPIHNGIEDPQLSSHGPTDVYHPVYHFLSIIFRVHNVNIPIRLIIGIW